MRRGCGERQRAEGAREGEQQRGSPAVGETVNHLRHPFLFGFIQWRGGPATSADPPSRRVGPSSRCRRRGAAVLKGGAAPPVPPPPAPRRRRAPPRPPLRSPPP